MDLPPISEPGASEASGSATPAPRLSFLTMNGQALTAPHEWQPALVCVDAPASDWDRIRLDRHDLPLPVSLRRVGGQPRILADWPRSGVGNYRLTYVCASDRDQATVTVRSEKLTPAATDHLLLDLETELPASIALALQQLGAFAGLHLRPAGETTLAQEFTRLQRAVGGVAGRPGLAALLPQIARDPHQRLQSREVWTPWERARRPHPARLPQAIAAGPLLALDRPPERVLDTRVEHTADVYENQLLKTYQIQVDRRLRRLRRALGAQPALQAATHALQTQMEVAYRQAPFLAAVSCPAHVPTQLTMVLQRRPEYRAVLEGYLELHRNPTIRLEEPALDAPFENLPSLYQTWGTLQVVAALLAAATEAGYTLQEQRLAGRDTDGIFVRLLPDGKAILTFVHPATGTTIRLIPERTYKTTGSLRSLSFSQRPDISVEIIPPSGPSRVILFDPKYKLDSDGQESTSSPLKADIDKMHTYRDAIRDEWGGRVVHSAHILYPGQTVLYGAEVGAIGANPQEGALLRAQLQHLLLFG